MKRSPLPSRPPLHGALVAVSAMSLLSVFSSTSHAQEPTPVRQLGQGGTAANPFDLTKDGIVQRQQREVAPGTLAGAQTASTTDEWWSGMSSLAEESMTESNWKFRFGVTAAYEYDTNFAMAAVDERETQIISVSPYGTLTYGEQGSGIDFQLRYAPEFRWFSNSDIEEVINHTLSGMLGINGARSRVSINAAYNHNEGGNVEVGNLVTSDIFTIGSLATYDVTPKTTLGNTLRYTHSEYDAFNSNTVFNTTVFADYAFTPKTRLGISLGYEHVEQDTSLTADAFNISMRASWAITDRMRLNATVGVEDRQFDDGESFTTPVGDLGLSYQISDKSSVQMTVYRRATPSIGQSSTIFYATGIAVSGRVQASDRIGFSLTAGFENSVYESTATGPTNDREDDYFFIRPAVTYTISEHWRMNFYYQFSDNDSTIVNSIFDRSQVGVSVTLSY